MKKTTCLLYGSLIVLAIFATIIGFIAYGNLWAGVLSTVIVMIPAVYSAIPFIREWHQLKNARKNRLTESIFTDRMSDLEDIIRILNINEHCVEIAGNEEQCGKSWMAKRLCDFINNPNDSDFKNIQCKCHYVKADYLDMDSLTDNEFNKYFIDNIVTNKTVLIFDHVVKISVILDKQKQFHFQMIYILKQRVDLALTTHTMSEFPQNHIDDLQRKIGEIYPNISTLTQTEINTLFQLTDGNIGRITALLSEQKGVSWIKDISNNAPTEYEKCLHKIELDIIVGKYQIARKNLLKFEAEYKNDFNSNMHLTYKYNFTLSNCEHMLNQYETALATLSIIEIPMYKKYNKGFKIELQKAHYNKHLWNCNEALEILDNIKDNSFAALVDSLGILAAKYFINDLSVPYSSDNSLEEFKNKFYKASNSSLKRDDQDNYKLKRYEPIFLFYDKKPKKEDILLQSIDEVIKAYEGENNRLRANAYFIKAEIYRLYQQYDKSILEYKRCTDVTTDDNIRIQTNLMIYYLIKVKGIKLNYELMPDDEISRLCQDNVYSCIVRHRIRNIELNDPNATEIQEQIDSRIMPIL